MTTSNENELKFDIFDNPEDINGLDSPELLSSFIGELLSEGRVLRAELESSNSKVQEYETLLRNEYSKTHNLEKQLEAARKEISAYRNHPLSLDIPDGWQLVPIEPTEEMLSAGRLAGGISHPDYDFDIPYCFEEMLKSAPKPESIPS